MSRPCQPLDASVLRRLHRRGPEASPSLARSIGAGPLKLARALEALRLARLVTLERDDRWHLTLAGCLRARALVEQTREQQALTARRHRDGLRPPEEVEQAHRRYLRRRLSRGLRRLREGA
jgi:DNA-binding transcriptional ArsR family regulator